MVDSGQPCFHSKLPLLGVNSGRSVLRSPKQHNPQGLASTLPGTEAALSPSRCWDGMTIPSDNLPENESIRVRTLMRVASAFRKPRYTRINGLSSFRAPISKSIYTSAMNLSKDTVSILLSVTVCLEDSTSTPLSL